MIKINKVSTLEDAGRWLVHSSVFCDGPGEGEVVQSLQVYVDICSSHGWDTVSHHIIY